MALVLSGCGGPPNVSGDWSGRATLTEETFDLTLDLEQSDDGQLAGSGSIQDKLNNGPVAPVRVDSGNVTEGGSIGLRGVVSDPQQGDIEFDYGGALANGIVSGDRIEGRFRAATRDGQIDEELVLSR